MFHPQSNGSIERYHHVLVEYLKCTIDQKDNWDTYLNRANFAYNTSVHEATGYTPHELIFGRPARTPSSISRYSSPETHRNYYTNLFNEIRDMQQDAKSNLEKAKLRSKEYYDAKLNIRNFEINDMVYLVNEVKSNKFADEYTGPYEIIEILPRNNVKIMFKGQAKIVHIDKLKIARQPNPG